MKTLDLTMAVVVGGLFAVGFYLLMQRPLMRIVLGFLVLGHGTNLLLLVAGGGPGAAPVLAGDTLTGSGAFADPLPQAMALTSIVITFGLSAFLMALAYRSWRLFGHDEVQDDLEDRLIGTVRERAGTDPGLHDVPGAPAAAVPDDETTEGRESGGATEDSGTGGATEDRESPEPPEERS